MGRPVMLSMGMGCDSAALLLRWIIEPDSRDFPLDDLVVVTAMTGDEYARTQELMERHLLPLMRQHRIRYVMIARAEQSAEGRYVVLSDSRETTRMVMAGPWRLSDELSANGTLPQIVSGSRRCSSRAKGEPLDWWAKDEFGGRDYDHVVGFAAEEADRRDKDRSYTRNARHPRYPLIDEWNWDRTMCEQYLLEFFGEPWSRSCCAYCPFQAPLAERVNLIERWRREPERARQALRLEWSALMFNPRMRLFGKLSARSLLIRHRMGDLVADVAGRIAHEPWAIYDVRRAHVAALRDPSKPSRPDNWDPTRKTRVSPRDVRVLATGSAADTIGWLAQRGGREEAEYRVMRAWQHRADGMPYPSREHFWVAGPLVAVEKQGPQFAAAWANAVDNELRNPRRAEQLVLPLASMQ